MDALWDSMMYILFSTDDAAVKEGSAGTPNVGQFQIPSDQNVIGPSWTSAIKAIYRANVFFS